MNSRSRLMLTVLILCALLSTLPGQPAPAVFPNWHRASETPVLAPQGEGGESAGTFNPAVILYHGKFVMLYRAQDHAGVSRLGYADSTDGIHFQRTIAPVLSALGPYERGGGIEDPRLVEFDGTFYLTYTAYNKKDAQLCLASSKDL